MANKLSAAEIVRYKHQWCVLGIIGCPIVAAVLMLLLFRSPTWCDSASDADDVISPDGQHVARVYGCTTDTGFGNVSYAYIVSFRYASESVKQESDAFITFDVPPAVSWRDAKHAVITVNGFSAINRSRHSIKGIDIAYRVRDGLTEQGDKDFVDWAKANAGMK